MSLRSQPPGPSRLTPDDVAAWTRLELLAFLYPYPRELATEMLELDARLTDALLERTTRPDAIAQPIEPHASSGPTHEAAAIVALLSRVTLDSSELIRCYRLVLERFSDSLTTPAPSATRDEWPGMRWVLDALGAHPSCSTHVLADMAPHHAQRAFVAARSAGRRPLFDAFPGCERCLAVIFGWLFSSYRAAPRFGDVLDVFAASCDVTLPHWCDLLDYELARLEGHTDLSAVPDLAGIPDPSCLFQEALAALATVDHAAAPAVFAVIEHGSTSSLADLAAACSAILSH